VWVWKGGGRNHRDQAAQSKTKTHKEPGAGRQRVAGERWLGWVCRGGVWMGWMSAGG